MIARGSIFGIVFIQCLRIVVFGDQIAGPTVKIPNGNVQGIIKTSYEGKSFVSFEGIPYAKPPLDKLRFKVAEPPENWSDTLVANRTYICPQINILFSAATSIMGQEDCLYINVYVPGEVVDASRNLDVVVHIHGGAFLLGSPSLMAGPAYIMDKTDVIYVSFNYRLGILGFLSTQDDVIPGNNGLKDQAFALKWIQDNIKHFGGNPESVTITGLSAGGASVHYHYFSPISKNLFARGLSMSGTALNHWALVSRPSENARRLAAIHKCPKTELLPCLQQIPYKDVVKSTNDFMVYLGVIPYVPFGPVIEKESQENVPFLTEHPYKLLMDGKFNDKPWIVGNTKDEGIFPTGFFTMMKKLDELDQRWNEIIPYALDLNDRVNNDKIIDTSNAIRKHYMGDEALSMDNIGQLVEMFSDRSFIIDSHKAVKLQTEKSKSPIYYYKFSYHIHQFGLLLNLNGTAHSDDSRLIFNMITAPRILTDDDNIMKDNLIDFIHSYATNGLPTIKDEKWSPVSKDKYNYMDIISNSDISMKILEQNKNYKFWEDLQIKENNKLFP